MATIRKSVEIDRPASVVWALFEDVRRLPEFSPSTTEVRDAPARLTAPGQRFTQVVKKVGRSFESEWEVLALDPGRGLTIEGSVGFGVTYRITEEVEAISAERSRATLTIDYRLPFGPLGRVASRLGVDKLADVESQQVLDGLRALLEGSTDSAGAGR